MRVVAILTNADTAVSAVVSERPDGAFTVQLRDDDSGNVVPSIVVVRDRVEAMAAGMRTAGLIPSCYGIGQETGPKSWLEV